MNGAQQKNNRLIEKLGGGSTGKVTRDNFVKHFCQELSKVSSAEFQNSIRAFKQAAEACAAQPPNTAAASKGSEADQEMLSKFRQRRADKSETPGSSLSSRPGSRGSTLSQASPQRKENQVAAAKSSGSPTGGSRSSKVRALMWLLDLNDNNTIQSDQLLKLGQAYSSIDGDSSKWTQIRNQQLMSKLGAKGGDAPCDEVVKYFTSGMVHLDDDAFAKRIKGFKQALVRMEHTQEQPKPAAQHGGVGQDTALTPRHRQLKKTSKDAYELFEEVDTNGDGVIDAKEFDAAYKRGQLSPGRAGRPKDY